MQMTSNLPLPLHQRSPPTSSRKSPAKDPVSPPKMIRSPKANEQHFPGLLSSPLSIDFAVPIRQKFSALRRSLPKGNDPRSPISRLGERPRHVIGWIAVLAGIFFVVGIVFDPTSPSPFKYYIQNITEISKKESLTFSLSIQELAQQLIIKSPERRDDDVQYDDQYPSADTEVTIHDTKKVVTPKTSNDSRENSAESSDDQEDDLVSPS